MRALWGVAAGLVPLCVAGCVTPPWPEDDLDPAASETFCAYPVIDRAAITDIHEGRSNGPEGYAYFSPGAEKVGVLPERVGGERFETCAFASNFQGPIAVGTDPIQWEWTADREPEESDRRYPVPFARSCANRLEDLGPVDVVVREDDEAPNINDTVGSFAIDAGACRDVLADADSGWTLATLAVGGEDVLWVDYRLWCYRCDGSGDCRRGVVDADVRTCN